MLIFDLDGTLSDSSEGIINCFNHALTGFGFEAKPDEEIRGLIGRAIDECFAILSGSDDASLYPAMVARYRERYADIGFMENTLYEGVREMLDELHAGKREAMGLCTTKKQEYTEKILEHFDLAKYFDFVSCGDVGIEKDHQLKSLLESDRISTGALMIGDRWVDIRAARQNGLHGAGVLWGFGGREELEAEQPRFLFDRPGQVLDVI